MIELEVDGKTIAFEVKDLVIAGWTGRDADSVQRHIAELQAIGVAPPKSVPCFYRVGNSLLTISENVEVSGTHSSGEVEFVLLSTGDDLLVGIGSDHTDRKVEAYDITVSKQMCPKPLGRQVWRYEELRESWDSLALRSWLWEDGKRRLYQEGTVARMRTPVDLVQRWTGGPKLPAGTVMFCGTLPLAGELGAGEAFEVELEDPARRRLLSHRYAIRHLPTVE